MRAFVVAIAVSIPMIAIACSPPQELPEARVPKTLPLAFDAPTHAIMALDDPSSFTLSPDGSEMAWIQQLVGGNHEYRVAPAARPAEAVAYPYAAQGMVWTERTGLITGSYPPTLLRAGSAGVRQDDFPEILRQFRASDRNELGVSGTRVRSHPYYDLGARIVVTDGRGVPARRLRFIPASNRDRILTLDIGLFDTELTVLRLPRNQLVVSTRRQETPGGPVTHWLHHGFGAPIPLGTASNPELTFITARPGDDESSVYAYRHTRDGGRNLVLLDLHSGTETSILSGVDSLLLHGQFTDRNQILIYIYERPGQPWPVPVTDDARLALELVQSHDLAHRSDLSFEALSVSVESRRFVFRRVREDGRLRFVLVDLENLTASEFQFVDVERPELSVEILNVDSSDGVRVPSFLFRPSARSASSPLAVVLHGGPMQHDTATPNPLHSIFLDYGFDVLALNYRGSTGHGFAHERAGDLEYDSGMIDDVNLAIAAALELTNRSAATPVLISGGSFGGHLSFATARSAQHNICALIAINPVSDLVEFQRLGWPYLSALSNTQWQQIYGAWFDEDNAQRLSAASAVTRPENWDTPVAVIASENDMITPERMVSRVAEIYADDFFTPYVVMPNQGHAILPAVIEPVLAETLDNAMSGPCSANE